MNLYLWHAWNIIIGSDFLNKYIILVNYDEYLIEIYE